MPVRVLGLPAPARRFSGGADSPAQSSRRLAGGRIAALLGGAALIAVDAAPARILTNGDVLCDFTDTTCRAGPYFDVRIGNTGQGGLSVDNLSETVNQDGTRDILPNGSDFIVRSNPAPDQPADAFLVLGRRPGSIGAMAVTGAGSSVRVEDERADGSGAAVNIGREGVGLAEVNDGALLRVFSEASRAVLAVGRGPGPTVWGELTADDGTISIEGNGAIAQVGRLGVARSSVTLNGDSSLLVLDHGAAGSSASLAVGDDGGAEGRLLVRDDSSVSVLSQRGVAELSIGRTDAGTSGTVEISGAGTSLAVGGELTLAWIGSRQGTRGSLSLQDGAAASIGGGAVTLVDIGSGGEGGVSVIGGSTLALQATDNLAMGVGARSARTAGETGGRGAVNISGAGSRLDASGGVVVAGDNAPLPPSCNAFTCEEQARGTITVADGGTLRADEVRLLRGGLLAGNAGSVDANVVLEGGRVAPGLSPGSLRLRSLEMLDGVIEIEAAGTAPGSFDQIVIEESASFLGGTLLLSFIDGYLPSPGDLLQFLVMPELPDLSQVAFDYTGAAEGFEFEVLASSVADGFALAFHALNRARPIPEPGALALLLLGAAVLVAGRARRTRTR